MGAFDDDAPSATRLPPADPGSLPPPHLCPCGTRHGVRPVARRCCVNVARCCIPHALGLRRSSLTAICATPRITRVALRLQPGGTTCSRCTHVAPLPVARVVNATVDSWSLSLSLSLSLMEGREESKAGHRGTADLGGPGRGIIRLVRRLSLTGAGAGHRRSTIRVLRVRLVTPSAAGGPGSARTSPRSGARCRGSPPPPTCC